MISSLDEALELARDAKAAMKASETLPEARKKARALEGQADRLKAEAEALKGAARLEDLSVWMMERLRPLRKAGRHTATGWLMEKGYRVRNFHLGSRRKNG